MTSKLKKLGATLALQAAALSAPLAAMAQTNIIPPEASQGFDFIQIIRAIIRFIVVAAFILAFVFLLIGGIKWITAGGDEKAIAGARGTITAALIGLVIVLVAFALIQLVETFFGVTILSGDIEIPTVGNSQ